MKIYLNYISNKTFELIIRPICIVSTQNYAISHLVHYNARFLLTKSYIFLLVLIAVILFILLHINVFIFSITLLLLHAVGLAAL